MKRKLSVPRLITVILLLLIAIPISYVLYLMVQYYRIPDNTVLDLTGTSSKPVFRLDQTYTLSTYNIGFGAYSPDFSFFMDEGTMKDGTKVKGKYGKAISKENVLRDVNGVIETITQLDPDLMFFQEVDEHSDRSYFVNQRQMLEESFPGTTGVFAYNFHTAYLYYPFNDPHGQSNSGLLTLSKEPIESALRRSLPIDDTITNKFFDLDRCFTVSSLPVENGRTLYLVNIHMSAYDEGGAIRQQQLSLLNDFMETMYEDDNYVIVGGDFNHILGHDLVEAFPTEQQVPGWISVFDDHDLTDDMHIVKAENRTSVSTCRGADIPYRKDVNYTTVIDGFLVSPNVKATAKNIETDYQWSDHQPVLLSFTLE